MGVHTLTFGDSPVRVKTTAKEDFIYYFSKGAIKGLAMVATVLSIGIMDYFICLFASNLIVLFTAGIIVGFFTYVFWGFLWDMERKIQQVADERFLSEILGYKGSKDSLREART